MGQKLIARSEYVNGPRGLHYRPGETFDATDAEYLFLMADAPGCFEAYVEVEPEGKAIDAPPADKMLRQPKAKK